MKSGSASFQECVGKRVTDVSCGKDAKIENQSAERKNLRRSSAAAAQRYDMLLTVALEEFLNKGFVGANLDEIAERSKVSKMTIYRKIGDKEALFLLTAEQAVRNLKPSYEAIIEMGGPPRDVIGRLVAAGSTDRGDHSIDLLRLAISEAKQFPTISKRLLAKTRDIVQPIARYLQTISEPPLGDQQAYIRALVIANLSVGGFLKLLGSSEPDDPLWLSETEAILINGLLGSNE
ncbi:transcriptional regulator, TetR family [Sphingobium faniae]|nr:transcriptional regulator, TetR family [Sphingobium faniae]